MFRHRRIDLLHNRQIKSTRTSEFPLDVTETELVLQQLQSCCVDSTKNKTSLIIDPGADSFADDAMI